MENEDAINNVADAIYGVANAMESMNEFRCDNGTRGSAMVAIAQSLYDLSSAMEKISRDFHRFVNHLEDSGRY